MADYTIKAVNPQTRSYTGKYGTMVEYKVLFEGNPQPVAISQKDSTAAPVVGQTLSGTIDMSGQYGPKFKKEYSQGGGGFGGGKPAGGGGKFSNDPFTMYLSYAKDLVVSLQETKGFDEKTYNELLTAVVRGGKMLYANRPGAEPTPAPKAEPAAPKSPEQADFDSLIEAGEVLDGETDPWAGPAN